MPRFDKWLTGVAPDVSVDQVARRALARRLEAVQHFLDDAALGPGRAEAIHQLRIWTRRSSAALRLFAVALEEKPRKWLKKKLRKIRRIAGEARDCDVQLERFDAREEVPKSITKRLKSQRRSARRALQDLHRRLAKPLVKRSAELLNSIRWPKRHSSRQAPKFTRWYRQEIVPLGEELLKLAGQDLSDDGRLHAFRIAGKRLRYALELAGPALGARYKQQLYDQLSTLQDRLGEVCDQL